jgi:hypothetical protein
MASKATSDRISSISTDLKRVHGFTLEQLCRALAAQVMLVARPQDLHGFLAPEASERTAEFIYRFALGEAVARPPPEDDHAALV